MTIWTNLTKKTANIEYLATQALDYLMTEDNDYLITDQSNVWTNLSKS
jgi:hypothetical protein